jgi:MoaA/NifB/PqqE/SkfB family radical SAM enzyme
VQGHYVESLRPYGGVRADGSCSNYDNKTKQCMIYDTRPDICRVEKICPPGMDMQEHFDRVEHYCDKVHLQVYAQPRERGEDCTHEEASIRLQFETVSTCNAACHFCVYPKVASMRRGNVMDSELFCNIVDEAASIRPIKIYSLQGLGEPFLDPQIAMRVRYIRKKDPQAEIELFTNGLMAKPDKVKELFDAGLDCLIFSLNAVDEESHQRSMGMKNKYETIVQNIWQAQDVVGHDDSKVRVHATALTEEERVKFEDKWGSSCKYIGIGNWGGEIEEVPFQSNECCYRALTTIYVMYDGRVTMCCFDPLGEGAVFGDLNNQTLREIYASPEYVQFREDHANDRADRYERCAGCTRI